MAKWIRSSKAVPPIHVIVKNGNMALEGVVAQQMDKQIAEIQAKSVPNVFSVRTPNPAATTAMPSRTNAAFQSFVFISPDQKLAAIARKLRHPLDESRRLVSARPRRHRS